MREDLAWPGLGDLGNRDGYLEYSLRVLSAALVAALVVLLYWWKARVPLPHVFAGEAGRVLVQLWQFPALATLLAVPAAALGFWAFPLRVGLGGPPRMRWEHRDAAPRGTEQSLTAVTEPSYWSALSIALVLASFSGALANLAVLLLFSPLVVFRLYSRLWTSMDLSAGRVYYHRTFFGLQIIRDGPNLNDLVAVVSGERVQRPEEPDCFAVYIVGPRWQRVALNTQYESLEGSAQAGETLALQLDVPHYALMAHSISLLQATGFDELTAVRHELWSSLALALPYALQRPRLPEAGEA